MSEMLWTLLSCSGQPSLIREPWVLTGEAVSGQIRPMSTGCGADGVQVGLWGPTFGTDGMVSAQVSQETEDGPLWLSFPLQTGVGEGVAALRIQGADIQLPLGARSGEFDLVLEHQEAQLPAEEIAAQSDAAAQRLVAEQALWRAGDFLLMDGESVVGTVRLRGEEPPMVSVHDITWLTPQPVIASRADDGGDLLLAFPVEPTLEDEEALIRINVVSREVVVPSQATPAPIDRRLRLEPGVLSEEERAAAVLAAAAAADDAERAWLEEAVPGLARLARRSGGCAEWGDMPEEWRLMLAGYEVEIQEATGGCSIEIVPEWSQHRRRFRGIITSE